MLAERAPRAPRASRSAARRPPPARSPLAAVALFGLLGCASSPSPLPLRAPSPRSFRIAVGDFDREPRTVTAAEAIEDLDQANLVFAQAYAGVDGHPPAPSPATLARAAAQLGARPSWRPDELTRLLHDVFAAPAPAPDGHLAFGYGGHAPLRLAAVAWRPPFASTVSTPLLDPLNTADPRPVELTREAGVPVLAIRTFDSAAASSLDALPRLASELRRAPGFVVDLRGNPGGNYLYAERFVLALTNATLRRLDEREVVSLAAAEGRANSVRRRLARGDIPEQALPRFLEQLDALERSAAALRARRAPRADLVTRSAPVRGHAAGPLLSRAVLLVDRGCASACEMLLALARQIPGVVVAGQNTRGGMSAGEIALFQLPRSGVMISLGTRAFRDPLGDFAEARGFMPDVWLDDDADVLAGAAALASRGLPAWPEAEHDRRAGAFDLARQPRILRVDRDRPSPFPPRGSFLQFLRVAAPPRREPARR